jgi:hypothetical protein
MRERRGQLRQQHALRDQCRVLRRRSAAARTLSLASLAAGSTGAPHPGHLWAAWAPGPLEPRFMVDRAATP